MEDFDLLKVIGKGSFGQVIQVCKKDTKRIYAMKVMNKKTIVEKNDTEHIKVRQRANARARRLNQQRCCACLVAFGRFLWLQAERRILQKVRHPFLMTLHMSFQSADKLVSALWRRVGCGAASVLSLCVDARLAPIQYLVMDFVNGGCVGAGRPRCACKDVGRRSRWSSLIAGTQRALHAHAIGRQL